MYQEFLIFKSKLEVCIQTDNAIDASSNEEIKSSSSDSNQKLKKRNKKLIEKNRELSEEDMSIKDCNSNKLSDNILSIIDERFNKHVNTSKGQIDEINRKYSTLENQFKSLITSRLDKIQSDIRKLEEVNKNLVVSNQEKYDAYTNSLNEVKSQIEELKSEQEISNIRYQEDFGTINYELIEQSDKIRNLESELKNQLMNKTEEINEANIVNEIHEDSVILISNKKNHNRNENPRIQIDELDNKQKETLNEYRDHLGYQSHEIVGEIQDEADIIFEESASFDVDNLIMKDEDRVNLMDDESLKTFMINKVKEKSISIPEEIIDQCINYFIEERTRKDLISEFELEIDALNKICKTINYYTKNILI